MFVKIDMLTKQELDVLYDIKQNSFFNQRILAENSGISIGVVNRSLKNLQAKGFLNGYNQLTDKVYDYFISCAPQNAIILAAGFGMRMVPINLTTPKAFLAVNGEPLIDRLINQLHEVGIKKITVVVGFLKDSFEYLIDEYGVDLVVNEQYASKNNLHSLALVADRIHNSYIVPCDIWCKENPFRRDELYSWYMVSNETDSESTVRINRKSELVTCGDSGNRMIGISYLLGEDATIVRENLKRMDADTKYDDSFWESALYKKDRMIVPARIGKDIVEINTYEELRNLDSGSNHLQSDAIRMISSVFSCHERDIKNIAVLKKGMTNRSFLFTVDGSKYIMRIPGEGTDQLINRRQEALVFSTISGLSLCDDPVYINPVNGYKITKFLAGVRVCNSEDEEDVVKCMDKLRSFHQMKLTVPHTFDIFGQIEFYEKLWEGEPSIYRDYKTTKINVLSLKSFIDASNKDWCLTHIDAVPDNFLFYKPEGETTERLQLTDWEYSGMQDPHVDIAMFCIYSLYNKEQCDHLIDIYFKGECETCTRIKIYCYIAACGLLWSNWCEFKRKLGVEFGEYSLRQYRFAKDYYRFAKELMERQTIRNDEEADRN